MMPLPLQACKAQASVQAPALRGVLAAKVAGADAHMGCCPCTQVLDDNLENAGVPYSYGFSIILLTVMVKLATFPLSKKQVSAGAEQCVRC